MTAVTIHGLEPASPWVRRWSHLVKPLGTVLDVACGHGRHAYWFHDRNHDLTLVDRSKVAIDSIALPAQHCEKVVADIEAGSWPFASRQFDAIVVTNYLWRPLIPALLASLAPGGVLIYETFTEGNASVGKPSRPEFLLRTGELLALCSKLRVVAFEDGFLDAATDDAHASRFIQRIAAVNEQAATAIQAPHTNFTPVRYPLN